MAPPAPQWAAFEEDGCADAGAIVYGIFLNVKNMPGQLFH
jgi:hypothetical protein